MDLIVYDNGHFVKESEMSFSIFDAAFVSGETVRILFRAETGGVIGLEEHLKDLRQGAKLLGSAFTLKEAELFRLIAQLLEMNALTEACVSCILSRGEKVWERPSKSGPARFWILTTPQFPCPESCRTEGVKLELCKVKVHPQSFPGQGLDLFRNPILTELHRQVASGSFFEGAVLNLEGQVLGGTQSDLFVWKKGAWHTPSLLTGAVDRVSRRMILRWIAKLGWECFESFMTVQDLRQAEECFLSSPLTGPLPVTRFQKNAVGDGAPGPITQKIVRAYREAPGFSL